MGLVEINELPRLPSQMTLIPVIKARNAPLRPIKNNRLSIQSIRNDATESFLTTFDDDNTQNTSLKKKMFTNPSKSALSNFV